jgi:outer membrane murein-binding lipoprotein Lpp
MADTHRVMIRLSPELYAQLTACGSSGQPLAVIVREALIAYLTEQPEQPRSSQSSHEQPAAIRAQLTAITTSLQELHGQVRTLTARVDALATPQQPEQPRAARSSHRAATAAASSHRSP